MITIYGLPRTGTNYLEFLVRNNLDIEYENKLVNKENTYLPNYRLSDKVSIKHSNPNLFNNDKVIIIIKEFPNFKNSFKKWHGKTTPKLTDNEIKEMYEISLNDYLKYYDNNKKNMIIIFFEDLLNNETIIIKKIGEKFNIKTNEKIIKTNKKMEANAGKTVLKTKFKFNDLGKISFNKTYEKLKNISLKK